MDDANRRITILLKLGLVGGRARGLIYCQNAQLQGVEHYSSNQDQAFPALHL
jgi:hypothetical protein